LALATVALHASWVFRTGRFKEILAINSGKLDGMAMTANDGLLVLPTRKHLGAYAGPDLTSEQAGPLSD
jgi:hypothetical protein